MAKNGSFSGYFQLVLHGYSLIQKGDNMAESLQNGLPVRREESGLTEGTGKDWRSLLQVMEYDNNYKHHTLPEMEGKENPFLNMFLHISQYLHNEAPARKHCF